MRIKVNYTLLVLGLGSCLLAVVYCFSALNTIEQDSLERILGQSVHNNEAEIALAKSHYAASRSIGLYAYWEGVASAFGFCAGAAILSCAFAGKTEETTPEEKRRQARLLEESANQQELEEMTLAEIRKS